ncbi:unnamed protein product [Arabidopsis lyrata]|uniref:Uncharacterized protein n=1 Tax=Arabidopsis lyrata subsp. lyrata TaxID=81972 RepID=D7MEG2_ARALL|nr:uncharacterized protein LOC9303579 [Arabidopsis lyrata subsp. lyrata]EFH45825.1 hypothetical protein ARALYDRAFT_354063 [Arabidopsis lyrata subsp. lyrata]CAH8275176.1 unnamed protein product [Arabidopsis lyrata]|eukprot:XP_002869566.1 uncharacterized protein LOC9303579 [Arabidopsis lyrata subsp. lyrata]
MTKKRNKKNRDDDVSMDVSESQSVSEAAAPQAMDTTETGDGKLAARARSLISTRKGKPMKRTKNASNMKAMAVAMDTMETGDVKLATLSRNPTNMKRTKNARKMKAVAKAIALSEKYEAKATKDKTKTLRTLSAKKLYE